MSRTASPATLASLSTLAAKIRGEGHTVEQRTRFSDGGIMVDDYYLIRGGRIVSRIGATVAEARANLRATT